MKISKSQLKQIILDEGLFANIRGAMSDEGEGQIEFDTSSPEFRDAIYDLVQKVVQEMAEGDPMFLAAIGKVVHDVANEEGMFAPAGDPSTEKTEVVPRGDLPDQRPAPISTKGPAGTVREPGYARQIGRQRRR